jgi:hypothetical protein
MQILATESVLEFQNTQQGIDFFVSKADAVKVALFVSDS